MAWQWCNVESCDSEQSRTRKPIALKILKEKTASQEPVWSSSYKIKRSILKGIYMNCKSQQGQIYKLHKRAARIEIELKLKNKN